MQPVKLISSEEELRLRFGEPSKLVQNKVITHLDVHCQEFIGKSPLVFLSTADKDGHCDVSLRGDEPGAIRIVDDRHLLIAERPGNRRADSLRNLLSNPWIGLLFLIPGLEETLRVNGSALLIEDEEFLEPMASHGRIPTLGIYVKVEECFVHCAKALKRSQAWNATTWLPPEERPNIPSMLADHVKLPGVNAEQVALALEDTYTNRLY